MNRQSSIFNSVWEVEKRYFDAKLAVSRICVFFFGWHLYKGMQAKHGLWLVYHLAKKAYTQRLRILLFNMWMSLVDINFVSHVWNRLYRLMHCGTITRTLLSYSELFFLVPLYRSRMSSLVSRGLKTLPIGGWITQRWSTRISQNSLMTTSRDQFLRYCMVVL